MPDISHQWGADLSAGPTGDLAVTDGVTLGQQRVLRRLLTNPGDYIWQPDYGAGLAQFIGQPGSGSEIQAVIRSEIFKEPAVARSPEPVIEVEVDSTGVIYVHVRYVDADTGLTQTLSLSPNG